MAEAMLVNEGCDYLRVTSSYEGHIKSLFKYGWTIAQAVEGPQTEARRARLLGYEGYACPQCFFGSRSDGAMMQVSGETARAAGSAILATMAKATRLDFQVTLRPSEGVAFAIEQAYHDALAKPYSRGVPPDIEMRIGRDGARAVTIGKRSSQYYARIYDKFRESGDEQYAGAVRWEVEVKAEAASALQIAWLCASPMRDYPRAWVAVWFREHGVTVPLEGVPSMPYTPYRRPPSTLESKRLWLSKYVAPTVRDVADADCLGNALHDVLGALPEAESIVTMIESINAPE